MFTETNGSAISQRDAMRELFSRHRGSIKAIAASAGVQPPAVSRWLSGEFVSANIEKQAAKHARKLLRTSEKS